MSWRRRVAVLSLALLSCNGGGTKPSVETPHTTEAQLRVVAVVRVRSATSDADKRKKAGDKKAGDKKGDDTKADEVTIDLEPKETFNKQSRKVKAKLTTDVTAHVVSDLGKPPAGAILVVDGSHDPLLITALELAGWRVIMASRFLPESPQDDVTTAQHQAWVPALLASLAKNRTELDACLAVAKRKPTRPHTGPWVTFRIDAKGIPRSFRRGIAGVPNKHRDDTLDVCLTVAAHKLQLLPAPSQMQVVLRL